MDGGEAQAAQGLVMAGRTIAFMDLKTVLRVGFSKDSKISVAMDFSPNGG